MDDLIHGVARFQCDVFPQQQALYRRLAREGQRPKALVISCADSRVVPELIMQSNPGELFVCRNAGNIVPPFAQANGGVSSAIEYAVVALQVSDIVVCGHSQCGAMKALMNPETLEAMPNVKAWLRHSHAACSVVREAYPPAMDAAEALRALALENVAAQLNHLRTHPSVAARIATGRIRLHGWFFELETGEVLALDGERGRFVPVAEEGGPAIALPAEQRLVAADPLPLAAE